MACAGAGAEGTVGSSWMALIALAWLKVAASNNTSGKRYSIGVVCRGRGSLLQPQVVVGFYAARQCGVWHSHRN